MWFTTSLSIEKPSVDHPLLCEINKNRCFRRTEENPTNRESTNRAIAAFFDGVLRSTDRSRLLSTTEQVTRRNEKKDAARWCSWTSINASPTVGTVDRVEKSALPRNGGPIPFTKYFMIVSSMKGTSLIAIVVVVVITSYLLCCPQHLSAETKCQTVILHRVIEKSPCDPPRFTSMYSVSLALHVCSYRKRPLRRN